LLLITYTSKAIDVILVYQQNIKPFIEFVFAKVPLFIKSNKADRKKRQHGSKIASPTSEKWQNSGGKNFAEKNPLNNKRVRATARKKHS
jgi:hypothetical protein